MNQHEPKRIQVIKPGFLRNKNIPELFMIAEKPLYEAIELFLENIDVLESQVRRELKHLRPLFTPHIKEVIDSIWDPWEQRYKKLVSQVDDRECTKLVHAISSWAQKYHLIDSYGTRLRFVEIGLQWLYLDSEMTEQERLEGFEVRLADAIQWDPTLGSDLLKERDEQTNYWEDYRARNFPFVFSPPNHRLGKALYIHGMTLEDMSIQTADNVVQEMSQIVAYDHWRSRLLGNLESDEIKSRAHRASIPYSTGRTFNPEEDNWNEFEAEMLHNFKVYLEAYKQVVLRTGSYEELPEKREAKHFKWLVMYLCNHMSFDDIASKEGEDKANISRSVRKAADIVGIELNLKAGRRKKSASIPRLKNLPGRPRKTPKKYV